ncbi:pilus assembly protein PilP [Parashewanella spongiae]|uniref:Pilus assembly protein PilP n=1 Tax=Parashewanella spongiae TaxID=342950 RepID=A0A3A6U555_9GAMM|nr:pilus assembly protein PilP [Parashewanella spongiae]MCL1078590.1 pilus assembly protein PilP [Parashewanella spongiae]RJY13110.1 pilus assembly protein PilP [Parashewanella spongiae]
MRILFLGLIIFVLVGCSNERTDLELFVTTTKAQHVAHIPTVKKAPRFEHYPYQAELLRSPFVPPSRELTEEAVDLSKNCLQPNLKRRKGQLETYALDNLKMRGTLSSNGKVWALIEAGADSVYQVGVGEHLGLYHGKIVNVTKQHVNIVELIPDGSGCWTERVSTMELTSK